MTIDLKRLLKKCRNQIARELACTRQSARPTLVDGRDSPPRDNQSQALSGTSFDRLKVSSNVSSKDAPLQHPRWDQFFRILLDSQADQAKPDRGTSAVAGNKVQDMRGPSSADIEDMTYLFPWDAAVETLKAQLDKVPEIRQQRVDSLKQAIAEGRYHMHPQQIAAAMLAEEGFNLG